MGTTAQVDTDKEVVLFDGVCNFCNASINFIIRHESDQELYFAALQSDWASSTLGEHVHLVEDLNTIVLIKNGKILKKSAAVFQIIHHLIAPWKHLRFLTWLPKPIADFFYDLIAKNRYSIFGKNDQCFMPTPELRKRFLDSV